MGFFGAAHVGGWVGGHTYPTMMKFGIVLLYVKKIQKIYESRDIPLSSADISHFSLEISIFCYIKNNMDMYRLHFDTLVSNSLSFSWVFEFFMIVFFLMTPGLKGKKIKVFWNKGYDIIYVHGVTNKISSRDSNYIADVVMWPKIGNSGISMRQVIISFIL